jgi:hypothetical protein
MPARMSNLSPDPGKQFSTALPNELRKAAAECTDPALGAALLEKAAKMELAEARLNALAFSGQDVLERVRADEEARRRRYALPGWAVAVTLMALALFLVLVALKHHV